MNYYVGLDISLDETSICVVSEDGDIIRELRCPSDPEALASTLSLVDLPLTRVGLEACSQAAWLHDGLHSAGFNAICIETRTAHAAMKAMPNKTDRNDARAIAHIMRTGWFREVHVKSQQSRLHRSLLVARKSLQQSMFALENVVRGLLREQGLKAGKVSGRKFTDRVIELAMDDTSLRATINPLLRVLAACRMSSLN